MKTDTTERFEELPVSEALKKNFMPYAMSVIVSRALPEIDGLKPSHRKDPFWDRLVGLIKQARASSSGQEYMLKIGETVNAAEYSSDRWAPDAKGISFYMDKSMIEETNFL